MATAHLTHAVLRRHVARGNLTESEGKEAWRILGRQGVRTIHPRGLFDRAWEIARNLSRPTTYDAVYLAAAALRECDLWTADRRLVHAAAKRFAWVRSP